MELKLVDFLDCSSLYAKIFEEKRIASWETNCIDDWEKKVEKISAETLNSDMGVIGGIPPWPKCILKN